MESGNLYLFLLKTTSILAQFEALKTEFWSAQTVFEIIKFAQSESVLMELNSNNFCYMEIIVNLIAFHLQKSISYRWNSFYAKKTENLAWSSFGTRICVVQNSLFSMNCLINLLINYISFKLVFNNVLKIEI